MDKAGRATGKADAARGSERPEPRGPAGVVAAACLEEGTGVNTGNPQRQPRQWLRAKYPHQGYGRARYSDVYLHEVLGLARLQGRPRNFPWATA